MLAVLGGRGLQGAELAAGLVELTGQHQRACLPHRGRLGKDAVLVVQTVDQTDQLEHCRPLDSLANLGTPARVDV